MRIISASKREDMVAFQFPELIKTYHKLKEDSFWVFWTKNPLNLIDSHINFKQAALQVTITGLPKTIEPCVPDALSVIASVRELINEGLNPDLINWRFDPIVNDACLVNFEILAKHISELGITRCVTSFVTMYPKVRRRIAGTNLIKEYTHDQQIRIIEEMSDIGKRYGITLYGCAQYHLRHWIQPSACIDAKHYSEVTGFKFETKKDPGQRKSCNCAINLDIGKYRPCQHGCIYCYAKTEGEQS